MISNITKKIPVTSNRENIKAIRFEGMTFCIDYEDGFTAKYRYEFVHTKQG